MGGVPRLRVEGLGSRFGTPKTYLPKYNLQPSAHNFENNPHV